MFVGLVELHIYKNLVEFSANSKISSRSEDRHEINNNLGFNNGIGNRREYKIILFVL